MTTQILLSDAGAENLGGAALSSIAQLQDCIAHSRLRHREVCGQLQQSLGGSEAEASAMDS